MANNPDSHDAGGNNKIRDEHEQVLAFYLMAFGNWRNEVSIAEMDGTQLISIELAHEPKEKKPDQGLEIIRAMSGMMSCCFNILTAPQG